MTCKLYLNLGPKLYKILSIVFYKILNCESFVQHLSILESKLNPMNKKEIINYVITLFTQLLETFNHHLIRCSFTQILSVYFNTFQNNYLFMYQH